MAKMQNQNCFYFSKMLKEYRSGNFRMTFWYLKFSGKPPKKFEEFLPKNLKSGQIKNKSILSY